MIVRTLAFSAALTLCATAVTAQTIYTDRDAFLAAITGAVTEDFEENGPGGFTPYGDTYVGENFVVNAVNLFTVDPDFDAFYQWNSGDVLDFEFGDGSITANAGITALGFDFGNPELAIGSGIVTINGVDYTLIGQPTFNFWGIVSDTPIATISWGGGLGIIDNVTTGIGGDAVIPEPATWALMIAGFGMVGASMRRRAIALAA